MNEQRHHWRIKLYQFNGPGRHRGVSWWVWRPGPDAEGHIVAHVTIEAPAHSAHGPHPNGVAGHLEAWVEVPSSVLTLTRDGDSVALPVATLR